MLCNLLENPELQQNIFLDGACLNHVPHSVFDDSVLVLFSIILFIFLRQTKPKPSYRANLSNTGAFLYQIMANRNDVPRVDSTVRLSYRYRRVYLRAYHGFRVGTARTYFPLVNKTPDRIARTSRPWKRLIGTRGRLPMRLPQGQP